MSCQIARMCKLFGGIQFYGTGVPVAPNTKPSNRLTAKLKKGAIFQTTPFYSHQFICSLRIHHKAECIPCCGNDYTRGRRQQQVQLFAGCNRVEFNNH